MDGTGVRVGCTGKAGRLLTFDSRAYYFSGIIWNLGVSLAKYEL
jgi:hypothetical protein